MEPVVVDGDGALFFELVGPLSAVLVLFIFPFGANSFFEEMVVRFEGEFRDLSYVVLEGCY